MVDPETVREGGSVTPPLETTMELLALAREGDAGAKNRLLVRHVPRLRQWAHGRLPPYARSLMETEDLIQDTLIRALNRLDTFEFRHEGGFLAYLRTILLNLIRTEIRSVSRRPAAVELNEVLPDPSASPLEEAIGSDTLRVYEDSLKDLSPEYQEAIVLRIELGYSYQAMAEALGRPTLDAARLLSHRALSALAKEMHGRTGKR